MKNWHLITDFETLNNDALVAPAVDCSVIIFDADRFVSDKPYTTESITEVRRFKLSVSDQVTNYGFKISQGTLDFWAKQAPDVKAKIAPKKSDLTLEDFVNEFHKLLIESPRIDYWWSRSNTFDPIILSRLFRAAGKQEHLDQYLKFWRVRDARTFIDAKFNFELKKNAFIPIVDEEHWAATFREHDSSWDVLADVLRFQAIARSEAGMEQVKK